MEDRRFYVYAYYLKSTDEIFHIGKGTGNRYKETTKSRNKYFINVINKYKDDVAVRILKDGLTEKEAFALERKLIAEYRAIGQCKTNLHEGGCGGNTGNYDSPERSRKLSEAAKKRVGEKNPMYGKHHSEHTKEILKQKNLGKKLTPEHIEAIKKANRERPKSKKQIEHITNLNKGKKMPIETYNKMMDKDCPYLYQVYLHGELIFENISSKKLEEFCSKELNISRTIINKVLQKKWKPTFKRHQHLDTLEIIRINRKCID